MLSGVARRRIAMLPVMFVFAPWWNCNLKFHPHDDDELLVPAHLATPSTPGFHPLDRNEKAPRELRHTRPAHDPPKLIRDDLVVRSLDKVRPAFTRCYRRAQNE